MIRNIIKIIERIGRGNEGNCGVVRYIGRGNEGNCGGVRYIGRGNEGTVVVSGILASFHIVLSQDLQFANFATAKSLLTNSVTTRSLR